jgi:hypothetical protein
MISSYNCNHYFEQKLYDNYKEITLTTYVKKTHALLKKNYILKRSDRPCIHVLMARRWKFEDS